MLKFLNESTFFGLFISIGAYFAGWLLNKKFKKDFVNPLIIAVILVIAFVLISGMDFEAYEKQASFLNYLLTPATICLAIPLYKQLGILKKNLAAVSVAVVAGSVAAMLSILLVSLAFGVTHEIYISLLPKSITTAIGMGVSEELGGVQEITVAVIVVTGVIGAMIGKPLCKLFKISNPVAVGLAFGVSAHAVGTSKALEIGEIEGAMSGLAIVVTGILTVALSPLFALFY